MLNKEVLVIPQYDAVDIGDKFTLKKSYDYLLTNAFFVSRDVALGNNMLRQIVPYVIYENKGKYLVSSYIKDGKRKLCLGTYNYLYNDYEFTTLENYILKGTVTDELLNDIASILITHKEIELFEEKNRNMIKRATFDVLLNENISPIINSSIENDEYKIEIFDSTYVPF